MRKSLTKSVRQEEFREWKGFKPVRHKVVVGCPQARPEAGPLCLAAGQEATLEQSPEAEDSFTWWG